jgi:outer membrane protein, multidrug efflux system
MLTSCRLHVAFVQSFALAGGLAFLGGCAVHAPRADVTLPAAYDAAQTAFTLDAGSAGAATLDAWWLALNDSEISQLISQALASSPTARQATAVLAEARAIRGGALSSYWPQGAVSGSQVRQGTSLDKLGPETNIGSAPLSWEIDLLARSSSSRVVANATFASAQIDYESSRATLAADVVRGVVEVRGINRQLEDALESQRIAEELLRVGRLKVERGLQSDSEIASLEGDLASQRASVAGLKASLDTARRRLLVLLGRGREAASSLTANSVLPQIPKVPQVVPSDLLLRRPDVRRSQLALLKSAGNRSLARKAFFPSLLLQPVFTRTQAGGALINDWTVTGVLTQPILDIPRLRSVLKAENARVDQAVIGYEKTVQTAYVEAENSLTNYQTDQVKLEQLRIAESKSKAAFDGETLRYRAGYSDLTSLLQKEQLWRSARTTLTNTEIQALNNTVTLFQSLGGGWSVPASKVSPQKLLLQPTK